MNDPFAHSAVFTHEAMHTTFQLRIQHGDPSLMRDMARECFELLDFLEARLSRFIDGSDVSRINSMSAGETLYISEETHGCLLAALDGYARTGGLFDITLGTRIEHQKSGREGGAPQLRGKLTIHPHVPAVTCEVAGREIDLGGVGKGFALDRMKDVLLDWGAESAFLMAGASSLLAFGAEEWPVDLAADLSGLRVGLKSGSISASGIGIQGSHIVHPAGGHAMPARGWKRLWVNAVTATDAEIWSTALMLVDQESIADLLANDLAVKAIYAERAGGSVVERVWSR